MTCSLRLMATGIKGMAGWQRAIELAIGEEDVAALEAICRSRSEPASRVERARILVRLWLADRNGAAMLRHSI
jgi:hypothetical protein